MTRFCYKLQQMATIILFIVAPSGIDNQFFIVCYNCYKLESRKIVDNVLTQEFGFKYKKGEGYKAFTLQFCTIQLQRHEIM